MTNMSKSANFPVQPLFDSHRHFFKMTRQQFFPDDIPGVKKFVEQISMKISAAEQDYKYAKSFLSSKGKKNEATYNLFRGEIERYLLWSWHTNGKSVIENRRSDIEAYIDFVHKPPANWISVNIYRRFIESSPHKAVNPDWRPFAVKFSKAQRSALQRPKISDYTSSQDAMLATFAVLNVFYDYLVAEDYALGNAITSVKKDSPYLIKNTSVTEVRRLSALQWEYILENTKTLADENPLYERTLFIIAALKTLYLRVSELSERSNWSPVMEHFWRDSDNNLWFKVFGKGAKLRDVTVPESFEYYLKRYRLSRGLSSEPHANDKTPLLHKLKGAGGMTARQLRRIVQQAFDSAYQSMLDDGFNVEAKALQEATTHWLRHTGASIDINQRPLKHMADELGHASMGTTDKVYIQSDHLERAATGKKREV
jgi:site-specific recombinase XerD